MYKGVLNFLASNNNVYLQRNIIGQIKREKKQGRKNHGRGKNKTKLLPVPWAWCRSHTTLAFGASSLVKAFTIKFSGPLSFLVDFFLTVSFREDK